MQLRLLARLSGWLAMEGLGPADLTDREVDRLRQDCVVRYVSLRGLAVVAARLSGRGAPNRRGVLRR